MNPHPPVVPGRLRQDCLTVVLLAALAGGCSRDEPITNRGAARPTWGDSNVVAQVGDSRISLQALERASLLSGKVALLPLINARVYGQFAETGGLESGRRNMVRRGALARVLMERIEATSRLPATPTDAEVDAMTAKRWIDFDRPEAFQTCHAIVHGKGVDAATGNALALRLADAVRSASRCDDFLARAKAFPAGGARITAEDLPPVLPDGRTLILDREGKPVEQGPDFDPEFARGAHQIRAVGTQSGIVQSSYGWHIVLLEAKLPAKHFSIEERRQALGEDILRQRAKDATERVIVDARGHTLVVVDRAATAAIGHVQVAP